MINIDRETGIRFGVINRNEILQAWADESEPFYGADHGNDEDNLEWDYVEPTSWIINDDEYRAECGEDGDIFIFESPYYTKCQFCSPCAPGAGFIMEPIKDGIKAYCFGHDWFDDGKAPYPIYNVKTDKLIEV